MSQQLLLLGHFSATQFFYFKALRRGRRNRTAKNQIAEFVSAEPLFFQIHQNEFFFVLCFFKKRWQRRISGGLLQINWHLYFLSREQMVFVHPVEPGDNAPFLLE